MSKSLKRVTAAMEAAGLSNTPTEMSGETRTAEQAAHEAGVELDQIAKSMIFKGETSGDLCLFITAGGNRVDAGKAAEAAGEPLVRSDGAEIRKVTGFAIGGVSPIGHLTPPRSYFDPRLLDFEVIWAAAGTPRHNFDIAPARLLDITGAKIADFTA